MQTVNNEPDQIEIRRSQNTLIVVGTGTILFSVWSTVKMLSILFMLRKEIVSTFKNKFSEIADMPDKYVFWTILGVCFLLLALTLIVRLFVGLSAISEGRGRRKRNLYLFFAIIMVISSLATLGTSFFSPEMPEQLGTLTNNQTISGAIIEATSMIMICQMIFSAIRIRKLTARKKRAKL